MIAKLGMNLAQYCAKPRRLRSSDWSFGLGAWKTASTLPPHTGPYQLANDFGDFFYKKIKCIKKSIDRIEVSRSQPILERGSSLDIKLDGFVPMSVNDVHNSIMTSSSASCKLDPITTRPLKRCSSEIAPFITKMINLSFPDCHFPGSWKIAHVNPLLKHSGLDAEFANFRSVNNLSFASKTTEKAAVNQLFEHCESCALLPTNQSACCKFHSIETALLRVQGDELGQARGCSNYPPRFKRCL